MLTISNHPFVNNKYTVTYFKIMAGASGRNKSNGEIYEKHHIIPESFYINRSRKGPPGTIAGNPNDTGNLVWLTPKEHFIAHKLLVKMTNSEFRSKMVYALWLMTHTFKEGKSSLNCRTYQLLRQEYAKVVSMQFKGRKRSKESITKQCNTRKEKEYKLSRSQIGLMQAGRSGKRWFTNGIENHYTIDCPEGFTHGYTLSPSQIITRDEYKQQGRYKRDADKKQKQSDKMHGRKWYNNGIVSVLAHECPQGYSLGRIKLGKHWYTNGTQNLLTHTSPGCGWVLGFTPPLDVLEKQKSGGAKGGAKCAGMKWWNDGTRNYRSPECPSGCVAGRLKFKHTKTRGGKPGIA